MKISWKKENFYVRKEFNSHRIFLVHQHGHYFVVLKHQYGQGSLSSIVGKAEVLNHYLYLFFLQDGKLVEEFFGLDCLHFSAQGHAAAALALWRNMVWYYLKTTPMFSCPSISGSLLSFKSGLKSIAWVAVI